VDSYEFKKGFLKLETVGKLLVGYAACSWYNDVRAEKPPHGRFLSSHIVVLRSAAGAEYSVNTQVTHMVYLRMH
jgi:hypothetical protein